MAAEKRKKNLSKNQRDAEEKPRLTGTLRIAALALSFLILGYQTALFVHSAAVERILSIKARPDTVYIHSTPKTPLPYQGGAVKTLKRPGNEDKRIERIVRQAASKREPESFTFNPNTVSIEDMMRLGLSEKQAKSIDNYRNKGGKFLRAEDFAKSYAVSEKVFERLKTFIDIPLLDINTADSAAFDALPGIGPYFASKMVSLRRDLGGYSCKEQLTDIWNFGEDRYRGLEDLIKVENPHYLDLWTADIEELKKHPYIRNYSKARGIVFYRKNNPAEDWTVEKLEKAGIIDKETALKLLKCIK